MKFLSFIILFTYASGSTFFVSNYGAYPNDNLDDTHQIQLAINDAIKSGLTSTIVFGFGIYNLSSAIGLSNVNNLTITGQGIDKTFLIGNCPSSIFTIQYCQGLTISSLSIDFDPLPFTAGYVINVTNTYLDLQVVSPHQTNINQQVGAILRYDSQAMRPAFGSNTYEIYQSTSPNSTTSLIAPGILRIPLMYATKFVVGDAIVARFGSSNHAISGSDAQDLTLNSINVYTAWCMTFALTRVKRLDIINFHALPRNGRWMSSTADCLNLLDAREYVHVTDSTCSSMGDDGLNVSDLYFIVTDIINSTSIVIQTFAWTDTLNLGIGTELEFSPNQQPFTSYTKGIIASIHDYDSKSRVFTFTDSIHVNINDYVVISDVPHVVVKNFTVANNRARGILLQTRNIIITQSKLNQTSGPAILFQPSLYWHEGPGAMNVTLTENIIINSNQGIAQDKGMITILPDPVQLIPVIANVEISSSTFLMDTYNQALLQAYNGNNIVFNGNYIGTNNSLPLINICNSRNITANNNTLVNTGTKIENIYVLDQTKPCENNLTSLIDIPPSAFNSTFSPPVF